MSVCQARAFAWFASLLIACCALGAPPLKVFILAGQSNMEGQAVADLMDKHHNNGKGTLLALLDDAEKKQLAQHLRNEQGGWRERNDVLVRFETRRDELRKGPLTVGFTAYEGRHHFGPELQFGHVIGDALSNEVLLIKTAWGGKSLFVDFRPPSSGGETGPYYTLMIRQIKEAIANLKRDFPDLKATRYELAGFVWYHGWNDGCDPENAVPEYEANLVNLIKDVRKELGAPGMPVVIGELTGPWVKAPGEWDTLRKAQAAAATHAEFRGNVAFVPTHTFVRKPEDSPNPTHEHHECGNAETYLLVGDALGRAMLGLMQQRRPKARRCLGPSRPSGGVRCRATCLCRWSGRWRSTTRAFRCTPRRGRCWRSTPEAISRRACSGRGCSRISRAGRRRTSTRTSRAGWAGGATRASRRRRPSSSWAE